MRGSQCVFPLCIAFFRGCTAGAWNQRAGDRGKTSLHPATSRLSREARLSTQPSLREATLTMKTPRGHGSSAQCGRARGMSAPRFCRGRSAACDRHPVSATPPKNKGHRGLEPGGLRALSSSSTAKTFAVRIRQRVFTKMRYWGKRTLSCESFDPRKLPLWWCSLRGERAVLARGSLSLRAVP